MATPTNRPGGPTDRQIEAAVGASLQAFKRLDRRAQIIVLSVAVVIGVLAAVAYYRAHRTPRVTQTPPTTRPTVSNPSASSDNLLLGNPSSATADPSNRDNFLMIKPYFTLSYNASAGIPNWVSWRVTQADLGEAARKQTFDADATLPAGFHRVAHKDYSRSGFDRGHMCPHSDRAADDTMSAATFVMTNIIPQAPNVNQKAWAQLEEYCRNLVRQRYRLYVVSGPFGKGGRGSNGFMEALADGAVTVPAECWKVIVVVPENDNTDDLSKLDAGVRVITVLMPNDNDAVGEEWAKFRTTPAAIEAKTGMHFFDRVRPDVAEALRQKLDTTFVPPPRPMVHPVG